MIKINLETKARAGIEAIMLRGGRLVKRKGQVISFAPHVGQLSSVSCGALAAGLVLGASLLGGAPAYAGTCDPLLPPPGTTVTCTGAADPANSDLTQAIVGEQLTINTTPGFGISTSTGDALNIDAATGTEFGLIFIDSSASQITAANGTALAIDSVGNTNVTTNGTLLGGTNGITATQAAVGSLTIEATGSVEGETLDGINAEITGESRDITVRAATVTGGQNGIDVYNNAYGNTVVESSVSVTAKAGIGIIAVNQNPNTNNLTIDVVDVSGTAGGIDVGNRGAGATFVSSSGLVEATNGSGISAYNDSSTTNLTIVSNEVKGTNTGIFALNLGAGNTSITSEYYVKGGGDGISASNDGNAVDITISVAKVTGDDEGINVTNNGSGKTSVTASGLVTGNLNNGITVVSDGTALTVDVNDVDGGAIVIRGSGDGINTVNNGNGAYTLIEAAGTVTGFDDGIDARNVADTTNLTISANIVSGGDYGIITSNEGTGFTSITASGDVEGLAGNGINATNATTATDLTVNANVVTGGLKGISVNNSGSGATLISASGAVTGTAESGINAEASGTTLTVNAGAVSGGLHGIIVDNTGTGATLINANGAATGTTADGINATTTGTNLTVTATGPVTGGTNGIKADNFGDGFTSITATGDVVGTAGTGIDATNGSTATELTVNAGAVTGGTFGIIAENEGSGATVVTTSGAVTGTTADGINAYTAGTNVTVTATGPVTGGDEGIEAANNGSGFTLVTATGLVTGGTNGNGIDVFNAASTTTDLTVNAGAVTGGNDGIFVENNGSGATLVSASGAVTGTTEDGIYVYTAGTDLTITANGPVTGGDDGIQAENNGTGFTSVTATGLVTGGVSGNGIDVVNASSATDLTVNAGAVTGGNYGIFAVNNGSGATSITASGAVTGTTFDGINAKTVGTNLTITANGPVTGEDNGIVVENNGNGLTLIEATGLVTGTSGDGVSAFNAATATGLTIETVNVSGGDEGIFAFNFGSGASSITSQGTVTAGDIGILVNNITAAATNLEVRANDVTGGSLGITTTNNGTGLTLISSTGAVTGTSGNGVSAFNAATATNLTVDVNNVTGGTNGIFATNIGTGFTSITASGAVTGTTFDGISAYTVGTNLTITANGPVTGGDEGIEANNEGSGFTLVTATGLVTGGDNGIEVTNAATAGDLTVNAGAVTGGVNGIFAYNYGSGFTSITATGDVTGNGANGIYANNYGTATDLTIVTQGDVKGLERGIFAANNGTGVLTITASSDVTGTNADGIRAVTVGANLIIGANNVTGGFNGIFASNSGGAATSITALGTVEGTTGYGIDVSNGTAATDLTVIANIVTGGNNGIDAENDGTGFTSVTANGLVTGDDNGIEVDNAATATDLTVNAAAVTGGLNGIFVENNGTGATVVNASGLVTGTTADGISVSNGIDATGLTLSVNSVTGGDEGINARNNGLGATSITSIGTVTGGDNAIEVTNSTNTSDLTVIANTVTAGGNGILSYNLGTGSTSIRTTGTVTGGDTGISVFNAATASGLTVNAGDVTGSTRGGIVATNFGTGATSVTSTGAVTGANYGIYAYNGENATGLTVSASNVTADVDGIYVTNSGGGDTVITATGDVEGTDGVGILARNLNANGGALRVVAISASGLLGGIVLQNDGAGASTVSVTGTIAGGDGAGIETSTLAGNLTTVNLATSAIIGATSGKAIANNDGNSTLNVSANAVINGTVELDGGTDTASFARNGTLATISLLDGGDNVASADGSVDTLNLNGVDDFNLVGANTVNWEVININGGTIGFSDARILAETINVNNRATVNGANNLVATANVNIAEGAALTAGNAGGTAVTRITGNLVNAGLLNLSGSTAVGRAGDTLSVSGNYTGVAAQVRLDTVLNGDNSPTDLLNVAGNVTGSSLLTVNNAGGIGGLTTGDGIRIVQVGGASAQDGFVLLDELKAGAFRYDLFLGGVTDPNDQDWYLRTVGLSDVATTTLSFARLSDDIAMTFLGTLHERVGEQEHLAQRGYQSGGVSGIWGRFVGKGFREKLTSPTLGDVKSTGSITGLQMGLDFVRNIKGDGSATFAGVYSGYADGNASDKNIFQGVARRSGTSDSKGWLTGLYGTHYSSAGWYANVVLQANWVDASANGRDGTVLKTDGRTYLGSFELGQSLKLADRLAFEPQAQLIYGDTQFDAATDSSGIENRVGIESSLIGRAGFRLKTTKSEKYNAEGGLFSGYLKANLWHNLSGADVELFSAGQPVGGFEPKKTWVDVGLGTTLTVAKNTEIYFDADVEFGLDIKNTAGRGNVGLRFNW